MCSSFLGRANGLLEGKYLRKRKKKIPKTRLGNTAWREGEARSRVGTPRIQARPQRGAEGRRGVSSLRLRLGLMGSSLRRWASLWRLPGLGARVTGGMLWKIRSRCYVQKQRGVEHHQACRGHWGGREQHSDRQAGGEGSTAGGGSPGALHSIWRHHLLHPPCTLMVPHKPCLAPSPPPASLRGRQRENTF